MSTRRRSLTHVGGEILLEGPSELAAILADALGVAPAPSPVGRVEGDDIDRSHVHGFHTYPARMHPVTAARLVRALGKKGDLVLDPFCGSGTVLVESRLAGLHSHGVDLNPLAVRLALLKATAPGERTRQSWITAAKRVALIADERRKRRAGASRRYNDEDAALFSPHVLLELDGLMVGLHEQTDAVREVLELVLSAILVKVSTKTSDTAEYNKTAHRIAAGYTAKLFVKKTDELVRRITDYAALLPSPRSRVEINVDDATELRSVTPNAVDLVVTSPPYAATYDYYAHHEMRFRWLNIDARSLADGELGARRDYVGAPSAVAASERWTDELAAWLRALHPTLKRDAHVAVLLADSAVRAGALRADEVMKAATHDGSFKIVATASQQRPHFHKPTAHAFAKLARREHLLLLQPLERVESHHPSDQAKSARNRPPERRPPRRSVR